MSVSVKRLLGLHSTFPKPDKNGFIVSISWIEQNALIVITVITDITSYQLLSSVSLERDNVHMLVFKRNVHI